MFIRTAAAILHRGPEPRDQPPLPTGSQPTPDTQALLWTGKAELREPLWRPRSQEGGGGRWAGHRQHRDRTRRAAAAATAAECLSPTHHPPAPSPFSWQARFNCVPHWAPQRLPRPWLCPIGGEHDGPAPRSPLLSLIGHTWQGPGSTPSFQLGTGFSTPPRAPSLFSIGSIPTTGPPFALLVLAQNYRKQATSPVSYWWNLPKPPGYDDVTLLQVGQSLSSWWSAALLLLPGSGIRWEGDPGAGLRWFTRRRGGTRLHPVPPSLASDLLPGPVPRDKFRAPARRPSIVKLEPRLAWAWADFRVRALDRLAAAALQVPEGTAANPSEGRAMLAAWQVAGGLPAPAGDTWLWVWREKSLAFVKWSPPRVFSSFRKR